jgi:hypothetical protein
MKFMLLMQGTRKGFDEYFSWDADTLAAHTEHMHALSRDLERTGELVDTRALGMPADARVITTGKNGKAEVTDGPFAETKEWLAGWWIIEVDSAERAYEIAKRLWAAPGPGGKPGGQPIEVREVMGGRASYDE